VDRVLITEPPTFCFVDGQHTTEAVRSDFSFCLAVCDPHAAVAFHDAPVVAPALRAIVADLRRRDVPFVARKVHDAATFVVFLRECPGRDDPFFREHAEDGVTWLGREWWSVKTRALARSLHPALSRIVPPSARPLASWIARRLIRDARRTGQS